MNPRNQNHQQQQQQQPAQASSKAGGFRIVGRYKTVSGKVGVEIRVSAASGRYAYIGAWGAGSGLSKSSMTTSLNFMLQRRRGVVAEIPFAGMGVR